MPTGNITPSIAQVFIPEVWANRALEILRNQIVLARLVTKDTDIAAFQVGSVLHIPYPGVFTAQDKTPGSAVVLQQPANASVVNVPLTKYKHVSFLVEDVARAQANQDIMDRYLKAAVPALAEAIETDIWAAVTATTGGIPTSVGTAGTNLSANTIRQARKALNDQKAPMDNRNLVISTKDEIALLSDAELREYFAFAQQRAVSDAQIGRVYGFDVWVSQLVPTSGTTTVTTTNLAFHPNALILAMRGLPEPPQGTGVQATTIRDDMSGLVLRVLFAYNPTFLGVQVTLDVLYGVAVLRPEFGVKVLS